MQSHVEMNRRKKKRERERKRNNMCREWKLGVKSTKTSRFYRFDVLVTVDVECNLKFVHLQWTNTRQSITETIFSGFRHPDLPGENEKCSRSSLNFLFSLFGRTREVAWSISVKNWLERSLLLSLVTKRESWKNSLPDILQQTEEVFSRSFTVSTWHRKRRGRSLQFYI